ncbi:response regulator transcription factor [uncultured Microbacterium sp.]|uniref:response regulator transcription factor n=1 Tax=uncultured Microbacterium sp. TaxID=191216 RepID=UPI0028DD1FDA|nr:response regulator transcription factor [uncultured Microbacterium sp.]
MTDDIRVLLVDDQQLVRRGFRMVLDAEDGLTVVGEAGNGREAVEAVRALRPDVVLMDVRMPGMDGIRATELITAMQPACRVIVLTTFDLDEYAFGGLQAGASGFLLKDARPSELVDAIRAVHRGDAVVAPRVTARLVQLAAPALARSRPRDESRLDVLSEREREVFLLMAEGASNAEIAERLFVSESTVKTHVGKVLRGLGLRDRVQAVIFAYEIGVAGS